MTYFSKQWTEAVELPDGTFAENVYEVDRYLKANGLSSFGDYSDTFRRDVKYHHKQVLRKAIFAEFIDNYKRRIWNATNNKRTFGA